MIASFFSIEIGLRLFGIVSLFSYILLYIPLEIWQLVGIWRSAERHPTAWGTAAKVIVGFGWFWITGQVAQFGEGVVKLFF
jgi:hypothetical protein